MGLRCLHADLVIFRVWEGDGTTRGGAGPKTSQVLDQVCLAPWQRLPAPSFCQCEARGTKRTELNKVHDDVHVIVIGKRSGKLCRCLHFYLQCFRPANRWDFMRKSRVVSVHRMCWRVIPTTRGLRSVRNASAAHKANHTIERLYLEHNAIGDDGAVALANAVQALLVMCASSGT